MIMNDWICVINLRDDERQFDPELDTDVTSFLIYLTNTVNFVNGKSYKRNLIDLILQFYLYENTKKALKIHKKKRRKRMDLFTMCFLWTFVYIKCDSEKIDHLPIPNLIKKWMHEHSNTRKGMERYAQANFQLVHNLNLYINNIKPVDLKMDDLMASFFKVLVNTQNFSNGKGYKVNMTEILQQVCLYENACKMLQEHSFIVQMRPRLFKLKFICCIWIFIYIKCKFDNINALPLPSSLKETIGNCGMAISW